MTGFIKDWLLGITACALAVSLAQALTPEGTVKKVGRLVGGLVLLLAAVRPFFALDVGELAVFGAQTAPAQQAGTWDSEATKTLIAEKTAAYIVDKGTALGCTVAVQVRVENDENGWPVPWSAEISGTWTGPQRQALSQALEEELNIPPDRQSFKEEEP